MKFSVIVTVYQVGPYLKKCVDSILLQTLEDYELILVDDGSFDDCPEICDAYAAKDKRVRVIHKKNEGVVNARKSGLLASKGKYIVFVDGDDWIEPRFLEKGNEILEKAQPDMVCFACSNEYGSHSEVCREPADEGIYRKEDIEKYLYPVILMNAKMRHLFYYVFGKIFCRRLAEQCFLTVNPAISFGEDTLSIVLAYLQAETICISHEVMTFYRVREQSGSHGFQIRQYQQVEMVLSELKKIRKTSLKLPGDFDRQTERYGAYMCFTLMVHGVNDRQLKQAGEIRQRMNRPFIKECVRKAKFKGITPKTRITYILFRKNLILCSYLFLRICQEIKNGKKGRTYT